ncbi:Rqc2 family fibronectin-binding protein [Candidatus Stoquefichus sp. SB1]|uniref:Rqc2 family fibronectin-binding protein n=1 Tax=Candidatus Stoquefichus sp. SB1 TaxID=1658109 RepID=UPI00067F341B|nr:NFACT RNA binding domain-containing protein [Candidatus Stoquefichus sp. SB1]
MAYDGIMLSRVVENLQSQLTGGRINKIYQISQYELLFHVRAQGTNQKLLMSIHPMYARIQLTSLTYPTPATPNAFTMLLRKHLEGAYIESIVQLQLDRIIDIHFVGTNEFKDTVELHLYMEIMGKHSNVIVAYNNHKIIDCLKRVSPSMSARIMQPGAIYEFPPLIEKKNPMTSEFIPTDNLTKIYQGISPELSREILYRMDHGEDFGEVMKNLQKSNQIYIHKLDAKEYFHLIPLTHLQCDYEVYPLFEGLDTHYHLIDQKDRIKQQTSDLAKYIQNEYQRNINKLHKLEKTLFDSQNSDEYRIMGDLLFANLHLIQKGQTSVTVENYYDGTMMTIELNEKYDGKTNANKYYAKYQKAKNALHHLEEQIALTKEEINYFDTLITLMENANYYDALEIKEELENLGYLKKKKTKQVHRTLKMHYETYQTKDNIMIYVGKNNLQNDYLTFKMASKNDMWFHVKDMPGSHVIVHSEELDEYTIRLASQMAAYFSKGKHSSSVPVNYTKIRTLKKPQGSKPGKVILSHYSTIYIDPDETFLKEVKKID